MTFIDTLQLLLSEVKVDDLDISNASDVSSLTATQSSGSSSSGSSSNSSGSTVFTDAECNDPLSMLDNQASQQSENRSTLPNTAISTEVSLEHFPQYGETFALFRPPSATVLLASSPLPHCNTYLYAFLIMLTMQQTATILSRWFRWCLMHVSLGCIG